jgi:hypothetical protein
MSAIRRAVSFDDPWFAVLLYAALAAGTFGLLLLPGDPSARLSDVKWTWVAIGAVVLWLVARGSRAAWIFLVAQSALSLFAVVAIGLELGVKAGAVVLVMILQALILFVPSVRPHFRSQPAGGVR